jgi:hypothetical protein
LNFFLFFLILFLLFHISFLYYFFLFHIFLSSFLIYFAPFLVISSFPPIIP